MADKKRRKSLTSVNKTHEHSVDEGNKTNAVSFWNEKKASLQLEYHAKRLKFETQIINDLEDDLTAFKKDLNKKLRNEKQQVCPTFDIRQLIIFHRQ